jgi:hypothetical protein
MKKTMGTLGCLFITVIAAALGAELGEFVRPATLAAQPPCPYTQCWVVPEGYECRASLNPYYCELDTWTGTCGTEECGPN